MEACVCYSKKFPFLSIDDKNHSKSYPSCFIVVRQQRESLRLSCSNSQTEMKKNGQEEENMMDRRVADLLEYLEEEEIIGEDTGRAPIDYNRRALIFEESSKVIQALKQQPAPSDQCQQQD